MNKQHDHASLHQYRSMIDDLDRKMLSLLQKRMKVVVDIAAYKRANNLPVFDPLREQQMIARREQQAPEEIKPYVAPFFTHLMQLSKQYQWNVLGSACEHSHNCDQSTHGGTHTHTAAYWSGVSHMPDMVATRLFSRDVVYCCDSYQEVFELVCKKQVTWGIVPVMCSRSGKVNGVADLLMRSDVCVIGIYCANFAYDKAEQSQAEAIRTFALIASPSLYANGCGQSNACVTLERLSAVLEDGSWKMDTK